MSQIPGPPSDPAALPPAGPTGAPLPPPGAGYPSAGGQPTAVVNEMAPDQQRLWAWVAHISSIVTALVLSTGTAGLVPFGFLGPLVIFLVLRERGIFVRRQAAEALNFQILVAVVWLVVVALGGLFTLVTFGIGAVLVIPLAVGLAITALVFQIQAAVRSSRGIDHRYPLNWRLVK